MAVSRESSIDLTCPVCYDTYRSPRFLPCHHTLCTECISDLMDRASDKDTFLCPLCQLAVKVPEDGVTNFQVNFYLAPLLSGRPRAGSGQLCQECSKRNLNTSSSSTSSSSSSSASSSAVAECQQCRVYLCRSCVDQHLQAPATAKHTVASLPGQLVSNPRISRIQKTPDTSPSSSFDLSCDAHWSGDWNFYCRSCCTLVCRPSCVQHQGQDHLLVGVAPEAQDQRSEVRRQLLSLTTFQGALADLEDEGKHRVTALEGSCQEVVEKMDSSRQQACTAIMARASKSTEKIKTLKGRIGKVVEGEMKNIQDKRSALSSLLRSANDALAANDADFLRQKTKLIARIRSVMSKVPPSRGNLQFSYKMSPDINTLINKHGGGFGYMTVQFQSPVLRHKLTLTSTKQQRKLRKLCPRGDGTMLAAVGNCLVTISADFAESKRLEFPGEIVDFLPARDGHVYVVLPFPHAVKVLDTSTDVAKDFVSPLNPPAAMAVTDKMELVFASNDGKELSLTFYSMTGVRLKRITIPRPGFTPVSMVVSKRGQLFLCSFTEVICLDSDFSDLASLGDLEDLQPRRLSALRGMGSGVGDVLVANWASRNVEIVELTGDKLTRKKELVQWKRGTSEEDVDLSKGLIQKISCTVLDQSGKLWVGQEDGHVSIYDWLLRTA